MNKVQYVWLCTIYTHSVCVCVCCVCMCVACVLCVCVCVCARTAGYGSASYVPLSSSCSSMWWQQRWQQYLLHYRLLVPQQTHSLLWQLDIQENERMHTTNKRQCCLESNRTPLHSLYNTAWYHISTGYYWAWVHTVTQYRASHRHSLELVSPHQVATLERLEGGKGWNTSCSVYNNEFGNTDLHL